MEKPIDIQTIKFNESTKICSRCHSDLSLDNIIYLGQKWSEPTYWDELHKCSECEQLFFLRHGIFDRKGHIQRYVFSEDINDPDYNWTDNLSASQKLTIAKHLDTCSICKEHHFAEFLSDIKLKRFFQKERKKRESHEHK